MDRLLTSQRAEYQADAKKTIIELQPLRRTESMATSGPRRVRGTATLVNLNPTINEWFVLTLDWGRGRKTSYHLENPEPRRQKLVLDQAVPQGLRLSSNQGGAACELWAEPASALEQARKSSLPYAPLCGGQLYLRNPARARPTELEAVTGFLRDHVWAGEKVISFVRKEFFRDAFLETATPGGTLAQESALPQPAGAPPMARVRALYARGLVVPHDLGIELDGGSRALAMGRWYAAAGLPGVYLSLIQPQAAEGQGARGTLKALDEVESKALAYLVAFDLEEFDLGFAVGTDHPRLGWSERVPVDVRNRRLPGPDGVDSPAPLVMDGMVRTALVPVVTATFTGGFKREHGAFREGKLAHQNHGSHYGFIQEGTVLSKLVPGLATLYALEDGSVDMKTWTDADEAMLPRVKYARQNGVPLVEYDPASGLSRPAPLVGQWGSGNWSGSDDKNLRTLRAGACIEETRSQRFLVYGYFSDATPSAMARVFEAYGCRYAMHLDMNALEHTYLALYRRTGSQIAVEHLIEGMAVVDRTIRGRLVPRFLGAPDDRDFFYLLRRGRSP